MIDAVIHPLCKGRPWMWLIDGMLHGIVECDPKVTTAKFVRYNLKPMLDEIKKSVGVDDSIGAVLDIIERYVAKEVSKYIANL